MSKDAFCYLYLSCKDKAEADKIAKALLDSRLVACAKHNSVEASYNWHGKREHSHEVLLIMESRIDLFDEVEKAVTKLHSYDTFVLEAMPISRVSKRATKWMNDILR